MIEQKHAILEGVLMRSTFQEERQKRQDIKYAIKAVRDRRAQQLISREELRKQILEIKFGSRVLKTGS